MIFNPQYITDPTRWIREHFFNAGVTGGEITTAVINSKTEEAYNGYIDKAAEVAENIRGSFFLYAGIAIAGYVLVKRLTK